MDDQTEKRKHPRKNVCWPISLLTDTEIVEGETVDISVEGISINIEDPVPLDEILRLPCDSCIFSVTVNRLPCSPGASLKNTIYSIDSSLTHNMQCLIIPSVEILSLLQHDHAL